MVRFDHEKKRVQLVLRAHQILSTLMEPEHQNPKYSFKKNIRKSDKLFYFLIFSDCVTLWRPEYAVRKKRKV